MAVSVVAMVVAFLIYLRLSKLWDRDSGDDRARIRKPVAPQPHRPPHDGDEAPPPDAPDATRSGGDGT
ncbi:hypothetical protein [Variovorax sp.]|uniref:hypothetical protein n=1 Tax=Variovorax sp. TaxID=1871043 RepID=UPI002D41A4A8|nr:hypothetical protein [Variovorax sp.]HYP86371.1 hypothetical protein [Variovorax sp.]